MTSLDCFPQIFNHLVAEFGFAFRNLPESLINGRISTKGRIEHHFRAFGSITILVIEVKYKVGNATERLDGIAQVIAECAGQSPFLMLNFALTSLLRK